MCGGGGGGGCLTCSQNPLRKLAHVIQKFYSAVKVMDVLFLFKTDCVYTLEPPRRGGSNEYPQSMCLSKSKKKRYTPCHIKVGFKAIHVSDMFS